MVCFTHCPIIKRDFAVVLAAQHDSQQQQTADVLEKQHQQQQGAGGTGQGTNSTYKVCCICVNSWPQGRIWYLYSCSVLRVGAGCDTLSLEGVPDKANEVYAHTSINALAPRFPAHPALNYSTQPSPNWLEPQSVLTVGTPHTGCGLSLLCRWCCCCCVQVDMLQARLCQMLGRSLYIDEATAKFYLEDAGGDMKGAMEAFGETETLAAVTGWGGWGGGIGVRPRPAVTVIRK